jgi:response regulator RpfG family c-di-GMP phosphodiesterase
MFMALKILLADPDLLWLENIKGKLEKEFSYEVDIVSDGKNAQLHLYNNEYFALVLNYEIQNHSGAQVLKFIKSNAPQKNMTTIVSLETSKRFDIGNLSEAKLEKLGVNEHIIKPFEAEDIHALLEGHQSIGDLVSNLPKREGASEEEEVSANDEDFTKILIDDFYSSQAVLFDIFVKLNSGRYVKILHKGDTFKKERVDNYKNEKKVTFLYFHTKDRMKYIQFNSFLANQLISNDKVDGQKKVNLVQGVMEKILEEAFVEGVKKQAIDQGKQVCEYVFRIIEGESELHNLLRSFQDFDPTAYTHAFLTTFFASSIIKQFDWQSKSTIESMAMAGMFHDIGKTKLPKEMLCMRPDEMSPEQLAMYKKHPNLSVEILSEQRVITNSTRQIIAQHHEYYDGSGFPHGTKAGQILTLANVLCLTNDFIHIMTEDNKSPIEALKVIISDKANIGRYNSVIIENFIKIFVDPGKISNQTTVSAAPGLLKKKKVS